VAAEKEPSFDAAVSHLIRRAGGPQASSRSRAALPLRFRR
jgi:hypothetical protein